MKFSRVISTLSFIGALVVGIAVGYVAHLGSDRTEIVSVMAVQDFAHAGSVDYVPVRTESLVGVWKGAWGYGDGGENCRIEIDRIDGKKFYGTLRKEGAEITIEGTLDPKLRRVFFHETKVLKLGPEMSEWSLGTNSGQFSPNGRVLSGTGTDRWGSYSWVASKD